MLQSVPDPFDSYGVPQQGEDQIFSILPPLSIMTAVPSSSPSPLTATPEHDSVEVPQTSQRNQSWIAANNGGYFSETTEWADVPSPSSTPPRSVSPPSQLSRKNSIPSSRKAESKLRSVLSVIDETGARDNPQASVLSTSPPDVNDSPGETSWASFTYGTSPYPNQSTPQNSTLFSSQSPTPRGPDVERNDPDEAVHVPVAT